MLTIYICIGSACHIKGSHDVIEGLEKLVKENKLTEEVTIRAAFCLGNCTEAVSVKIDDTPFSVNPSTVSTFFEKEVLKRV